MGSLEPTPERLERFMTAADDPGPIVMVNLLRYRAQAEYPPGMGATPCSGREAYSRYAEIALRKVAEVGGRLLWMGSMASALIGPEGEEWDDVVLVEYPSRRAFLDMVSRPTYQAAAVHRTAALADSRLIATTGQGAVVP
jgi:uncharacterized protein (DUF1330 family)